MSKKDVIDKVPIYTLKTTEDIMKHYDMWGDKYDKDMVEWKLPEFLVKQNYN